eukprot:scaffold10246_cov97-Skeletonema_marinoi.AAC.4
MSNANFSVGDLIRIHGLVSKPQFNQMIGVVKAFHENTQRYEIQPSRGSKTLALKAVNLSDDEFLKPTDDKFKTERVYDNVFLWPSPTNATRIPIQCYSDCPSADFPSRQDEYIQSKLGWKSVDTLSGIEEEGREKPTFLQSKKSCSNDNSKIIARVQSSILFSLQRDYKRGSYFDLFTN